MNDQVRKQKPRSLYNKMEVTFFSSTGVNLRGDFNVEPVIRDSDEEVDADPMMTGRYNWKEKKVGLFLTVSLDEQKRFYKLFWRTRQYFTNPPTIFQGDNFSELQIVSLQGNSRFLTLLWNSLALCVGRGSDTREV